MSQEHFLRNSTTNIDFEVFAARFIMAMQSGAGRDILESIVENDGPPVLASVADSIATTRLRSMCLRTMEGTYLFISGISSPEMGRSLWEGYQNPSRFGLPHSNIGNTWIRQQGQFIWDNIVLPVWDRGPLKIVGYSAGGAAGVVIYNIAYSLLNSIANLFFLSFGAPAVYGAADLPTVNNRDAVRLFNADDPVPLVPFMDPVAFGATWTMGVNNVAYLNSFAQWPGGVQLGIDNHISPQRNPVNAQVNRTASVQTWLAQADRGLVTSHSIDTYIARLEANRPAPQPVAMPSNPPIQLAAAVSRPEIVRRQERDVQTIFADASVRNAQPVRIPDTRLFHAVHRRPFWNVEFNGTIVSTSRNRRRAQGLARMGNDFLRRLQRQEIVGTDDLAAEFLNYLTVASTPGSEIQPTLNQGFPVRA